MTADMKKKMGKRIGAGALVVLHLWSVAAYAAVCSSNEGLGSVLSVLPGGAIVFNGDSNDGGKCNNVIYGAASVNTTVLTMPGGVTSNACQTIDEGGTSKVLAKSDMTKMGPTLIAYSGSTSTTTIYVDANSNLTRMVQVNGSDIDLTSGSAVATLSPSVTLTVKFDAVTKTVSLPGGDYGSIGWQNLGTSSRAAVISFDGPVRIKTLGSSSTCNSDKANNVLSGLVFSQDDSTQSDPYKSQSYVNELKLGDACALSVKGPNRTTLNVLGVDSTGATVGLTFPKSNPCINFTPQACLNPTGLGGINTWTEMDAQHPERLQINLYNGDYVTSDSSHIAAGVYVPNGVFNPTSASKTTFVGEVLAKSINQTQNNGIVQLFNKSTSTDNLRTAAYSLTPPVADAITDTGSYVYRAMQNDYLADGKTPGTSGHLKAFALKADSSQETSAVWDAADKMDKASRAAAIQTETDDWASSGVDFKVLDAAYACVIDPRATACRDSNDPRDKTSILGVPWRVAPIIVGDSVLFATDDGVLYSVNKTTGSLNWGWIPKEILARTVESNPVVKMADKHSWGQIDSTKVVVTAADGSQTTHTYVLGTALGGQLHFALEVSNNGATLSKLLWRDYQAYQFSPGSAVAGWAGVSGRPYGGAAPAVSITDTENKVAYVKGGKLFVRKLDGSDAPAGVSFVAGGEVSTSAATYAPTSNLLYVDESSIYFGSFSGKVYQSNKSGVLANVADGVDKVALGADPVWYVNATQLTSATGNALMLLAQTQYRVNILKFAGDKWTFAWYTGLTAAGLGDASPTTQKVGTVAADKAYLSASADILNGSVILYYTTKPDTCTINGYTFGPLKLEDGSALMDSEFRLKGIDSLSNLIGRGEATGGNFTVFKDKAGVLTGSAGDSLGVGDIGLISHASKSGRQRLNWRELTNFF